ncbi:hypothetical protein HYT26_03325 [Candidatus Pacearchaeota archaeon]|nr:hypothetical protein [Candidatus Pacearchaeota archaeon]
MKNKSIFILLGILMVFVIGGCTEMQEENTEEKYPSVIIGKPISVAPDSGGSFDYIAVVLEVDGKNVLAITDVEQDKELTAAIAIIQSEIAKGDEGQIELRGHYPDYGNDKGRFIIQSVKANGLEVKF